MASALNSTYPQHASRSTREHARRRGADVAVPFFQAELLRRESDFAKAAPAQGTPPPTRPPAHPPTRIYRPGSGHLPAASPSTLRRKGTLAFSGARCAAGGDSTSSYIKPFWDTMYLGGRHGRRSGSHWGTCRHAIPIHFRYSLGTQVPRRGEPEPRAHSMGRPQATDTGMRPRMNPHAHTHPLAHTHASALALTRAHIHVRRLIRAWLAAGGSCRVDRLRCGILVPTLWPL